MWEIYVAAADALGNCFSESDLNARFGFDRWDLHQERLIKTLQFAFYFQPLRNLRCQRRLHFGHQRLQMWVLLIQLVDSDDFDALLQGPIKCLKAGLSVKLISFIEKLFQQRFEEFRIIVVLNDKHRMQCLDHVLNNVEIQQERSQTLFEQIVLLGDVKEG